MATASEIRTFQSATSSELQQAQSLIFRNKAFAARGDPRLQSIISVLGNLSQLARDRAIAEAQAREQVQTLATQEDLAQQSFPVQIQTPIPTQRDIRSVVGLPTAQERFEGFFSQRGLKSPTIGIPELAEDVISTVTIPERAIRETPVTFINIPSTIGGTQITRPPSFEDIDTGRLPPKQNIELKTQKIISDFNQEVISEEEAIRQLGQAEDKFILDESKRTAIASVAGGLGLAVISGIAPPVGAVIGGAFVTSGVAKRKEILEFSRRNPKAAAIQFISFAAGGISGAGAVSRLRAPKLDLPKVKLVGKGRDKFIRETIKTIEPDFETLQSSGRITGTRAYEIEIPTPRGKTILKILEFEKDGVRNFAGQEISKGKVKALLTGVTLESGKDGLNRLITRIVTERNQGRLSNLEIQTFVEKAVVKSSEVKGLRRITLTENEAKLVKQFNLNGLTPEQVRAILRKPLFSEAEIARRKNIAFTDAEFNAAKQLTKSEIVLGERVTRIRVSKTDSLGGGISTSKGILDIRTLEQGSGFIKKSVPIVETLKKIKVKVTKEGDIVPVGKFPTPSKVKLIGEPSLPIKIKKIPKGKKTPLAVTFAEEATTPLLKLKKKPITTSVFLKVAKQIQKRKVKQAKAKQVKVDSLQATLRGLPRSVGGEGLTEAQLAKFGGGISEIQIGGILPPLSTLSITQLNTSIQTSTSQLTRINTSLKNLSKDKANPLIKERIVSLTKIKLRVQNKLKLELKQKLRLQQKLIPLTKAKVGIPPKAPPVVKLPTGIEKTKLVKKLVKLRKQGVNVIVGMGKKQRIVAKNLPPFKALKFGRDFVDKNIAASFRLKKSGKKTKKKDIKPFNVGNKFRPSKRDPLFIVEKRFARLDSPQERLQIKLARKGRKRKTKKKNKK